VGKKAATNKNATAGFEITEIFRLNMGRIPQFAFSLSRNNTEELPKTQIYLNQSPAQAVL
jgi:hypothetical protein